MIELWIYLLSDLDLEGQGHVLTAGQGLEVQQVLIGQGRVVWQGQEVESQGHQVLQGQEVRVRDQGHRLPQEVTMIDADSEHCWKYVTYIVIDTSQNYIKFSD